MCYSLEHMKYQLTTVPKELSWSRLSFSHRAGIVKMDFAVAVSKTSWNFIDPFHLYPLKTSENQRFSDVFRGYRKKPVAWNGLKKRFWHSCFPVNFVKFLRTSCFIEHLPWLLPS